MPKHCQRWEACAGGKTTEPPPCHSRFIQLYSNAWKKSYVDCVTEIRATRGIDTIKILMQKIFLSRPHKTVGLFQKWVPLSGSGQKPAWEGQIMHCTYPMLGTSQCVWHCFRACLLCWLQSTSCLPPPLRIAFLSLWVLRATSILRRIFCFLLNI